jgi:hypothetical protein
VAINNATLTDGEPHTDKKEIEFPSGGFKILVFFNFSFLIKYYILSMPNVGLNLDIKAGFVDKHLVFNVNSKHH